MDLANVVLLMAKLSKEERAALSCLRYWLRFGALFGHDSQGRPVYIVCGANGRLFLTFGTPPSL